MPNEQNPVEYLPDSQLQPEKKVSKWLIISIAAVIFITLLVIAAVLGANKDISNQLEDSRVETSLEQRFIDNLEAGNVKALVDQNELFQDKEHAVTTIDWMQSYLSLENCTIEQKTDKSEFNGTNYYQATISCPAKLKTGKPDKYKRFLVVTFKEKSIIYLEVNDTNNKHAKIAELAEAFRW